jgi:hypothetical protein
MEVVNLATYHSRHLVRESVDLITQGEFDEFTTPAAVKRVGSTHYHTMR